MFAPPSVRRNFFKCAPPLTWNPGSALIMVSFKEYLIQLCFDCISRLFERKCGADLSWYQTVFFNRCWTVLLLRSKAVIKCVCIGDCLIFKHIWKENYCAWIFIVVISDMVLTIANLGISLLFHLFFMKLLWIIGSTQWSLCNMNIWLHNILCDFFYPFKPRVESFWGVLSCCLTPSISFKPEMMGTLLICISKIATPGRLQLSYDLYRRYHS
jgi:hypothetical protein